MPELLIKKRVDRLERLMEELAEGGRLVQQQINETNEQLARTDRQLARTEQAVAQFSFEMRDFKDEMREAQEEMRAAQERSSQAMQATQERSSQAMQAAQERSSQAMQAAQERVAQEWRDTQERTAQEWRDTQECTAQEWRDAQERAAQEWREKFDRFSEEMHQSRRESRQEWGKLNQKMGTMAEDMVAPSIPHILRQTVGCPKDGIEFLAVRVKKMHPQTRQQQEYDVVAVCGDYLLINETKSSLKPRDIQDFVDELLVNARGYFPEYADRKIIGAIASLYVDESLVRMGERLGVIVLGFSEDVMDVLNSPGFIPKTF